MIKTAINSCWAKYMSFRVTFVIIFLFSMMATSDKKQEVPSTIETTLNAHSNDGSSDTLPPHFAMMTACVVRKLRLQGSKPVWRWLSTDASLEGYSLQHPSCNLTPHLAQKVGINLHRQPNHPLGILQNSIQAYFKDYPVLMDLSPIVSTQQNFESLRIPLSHPSRSPSDTYYLNDDTVLRTHTSAHQVDLLSGGYDRFLVTGDVYRRDEIDRSHYPIFHQMEGVRVWADGVDQSIILHDLRETLEGLAVHLFGPTDMRWVDAYFPFTEPSLELEILYQGEWLEVLGCGVIHPDIMKQAGRPNDQGWAFGLGLERLAMVLFQIPDIRLFWTTDERFHKQFESGDIIEFVPYSKYPPCLKDVSFWLSDSFHVNDLNEIVRGVAGDLAEQVQLIDNFTNPKSGRTSHCYRISYRSMDRSLTNEEIDQLQEQVRVEVQSKLGVELR